MKKAYLILENGSVFEGKSFGAEIEKIGELVFTTGMCGYVETLTDESYFGQIVCQTFPLIGNYGICEKDFEGKCSVFGYVVREECDCPSNFRSEYKLSEFLKKNNIPAISGVDTREITKIIRESGVMNAKICFSLPSDLAEIKAYCVKDAVKTVTASKEKLYKAENEKYKVTLIDYGAKNNIIRELTLRGCTVRAVPAYFSAADILKDNPDGIMLSNGPGDPKENVQCIEVLKEIIGKKPVFGICLGHQLTALALGGDTVKLKYGHRGVNQPVKETNGERTYITSQNHGYAVVGESVKGGVVSFINANDLTCEGIDYPTLNAFTVQFHPEAHSGPLDTSFLFDKFIKMMGGTENAAR